MQLYTKESEPSPGASVAASIFARNLSAQDYSSVKIPKIKDLIWRLCAWRDLMARIHDDSLRYVLSDQAIVALAVKVPKNPTEIFDVIQKADLSRASTNVLPVLPSSAPIVATHVNELCCLFQEVDADISDILRIHLQKHLNPSGCCPLSIYNHALLSEFSLKQMSTSFSKYNGGKSTAPVCKKASRELFVQKFSCKSPVYHNCKIYASDGRLLCYCDRKKLEWYIQRDLAKIVEDDPPAIMLLFEPKGRPEDEDNDFYVQSKKNICVGCGERNHYLRYRIIPSCYRMHFPEHLKSHRSHDIVLLCVDCHEIAHSAAEKYKRQIASEFDIPLFVRRIVDPGKSKGINLISSSDNGVEEAGVSPLQLRTAAMALLRHGSSMPSERHDELMQIVKAYFGGREISPKDLEMALLVGMSPHERRRLEKKKGWTFKHKGGSHDIIVGVNSTIQKVEYDKNCSDTCNSQESLKDVDVIDFDAGQMNTSVDDIDAISLTMKDACGVSSNKQSLDKEEEECKRESGFISNYDNGNGDTLHEVAEPFYPSRSDHVLSSKSAKKLSLLGHGPHGKQVVEHLLNNYGEDGICQFCQRWRQVFVEAVQPRFLPSGWDIKHSGRRDFGDYSIYNPAKRVPETVSGLD